jgi:hypothetical protein
MNNISIFIGTCDKYAFLWDDFVYLFNKYWDHSVECKKYFLSDKITKDYEGFDWILGNGLSQPDKIKLACDSVEDKYILWLQDDYFFRRTISKEEIFQYIGLMELVPIDRFGIHVDSMLYSAKHISDKIYKLNQFSSYSISLQASIWNKNFLKYCTFDLSTPWEMEINGTMMLNNKVHHQIYYAVQEPPWYLEAMSKGEFTTDYYKIKKEEGL